MSIANETTFAVQPVPLLDPRGRDVLVVVVKGTFAIDARGGARRADDPAPVRVVDELWEPGSSRSSVRFPCDLGLEKLGTDVVVVGDAVSAKPVASMDVAMKIKDRTVPLRVHGPRVYYDAALGVAISAARPCERVPIVYERAYGGSSRDLTVVDLRNPVGVGVARSAAHLEDQPAPQIEHPARPHCSPADRHAPVGTGAIMTHWSPRRERVGTLDERWRTTRMPLLPEDYDARFGNVAHPSLQFEEHLSPGDPIGILGMSLSPLVLQIPTLDVVVAARYDTGERVSARPPIDTIIIQPELRRVELVARATLPLGRGRRVLRETVVRNHD